MMVFKQHTCISISPVSPMRVTSLLWEPYSSVSPLFICSCFQNQSRAGYVSFVGNAPMVEKLLREVKQNKFKRLATRYIPILAVTSKQKSQGTILLKLEPPSTSWFSICLDFIKNREADRSTDFNEIGQGPKLTMGKNVTCFLYSNSSL